MASIILNCPVNIRRSFSEMLKGFTQDLGEKTGIDISIKVQQRPDEPLLQQAIEAGEIPDVVIAHAVKLVDLGSEKIKEYFQPLPACFPIRQEMIEKGFVDPSAYLNTFAIVPFVIIYNRHLIRDEDIPSKWEELIDSKWWGQVTAPFAHHVVSRLALDFIKYHFPDRYEGFMANTYFSKSPQETVIAVDEGRYPLGIMNISFAKFSRNKNVGFIWPEEGALCSPQVMVFKKDIDQRLLTVGDFLMSANMQEFFCKQDFIPAYSEIEISPEVLKNKCNFWWEGWDDYFNVLAKKTIKGK